jgi:hypothetical protein
MRLWGFEKHALWDVVTVLVLMRRPNEGQRRWLSVARRLSGNIGTDRERDIGGGHGRCASSSATGGDPAMMNVGIARW